MRIHAEENTGKIYVRMEKHEVVQTTGEECTLDAIVMGPGRVFSDGGCLFSLLPLCHFYPFLVPASSLPPPPSRGPLLSLFGFFRFLRYIAEIYGLFAENARRRAGGGEGGGRRRGRFDKSLLVKRLPDCRERG